MHSPSLRKICTNSRTTLTTRRGYSSNRSCEFIENSVMLTSAKLGETPLHKVASENVDCIKFLVQNGASLNCVDKYGRTPLHKAASSSDAKFIKAILGKISYFFKSVVVKNFCDNRL